MNLLVSLAVFGVVFPAELPDKTMIAAIVLGTRFHRPAVVWAGIAAAFLVHVTIAVTAGGLVSLLPRWIVGLVAASLFLVGAIVLVREPSEEDEAIQDLDDVEERIGPGEPTTGRIMLTGFVTVFVAEWGDLTQILTATLAARYHDPLSVGLGALLALWSVAAIGVFAGRGLVKVVPVHVLRRIAATVLVLLAVLTVIEVVR